MKKKLLLSIVLSFVMVFAFSSMAMASNAPQLLKTENAVISGQNVIINTYDDNGVIVETVTLPEQNAKTSNSQLSEYQIDEFLKSRSAVVGESQISTYGLGDDGYISFSKRADSPQNAYCAVRAEGNFVGNNTLKFKVGVADGYIQGYYGGSTTATKIQLTETYTYSGLGLSISWPAGVSVSSNSKTGTWSSLAYNNTNLAKAYRGATSTTSSTILCSLNIQSRADIYLGSTSYPAIVNADCNASNF